MSFIQRSALPVAVALLVGICLSAEAQTNLEQLEQQAIQDAVARVAPSVVRIQTVGGLEKVGRAVVAEGASTGLIVATDGWIVSSAYAFIQEPTSVLVTLHDGTRLPAKSIARDLTRMLVLLKVEAKQPLPVGVAAPRDKLAVGQWAIAVGRSLSAETANISVGILSALDRIWGKAVQTDAKISYANYGGPLIDIQGRIIGVLVPLSPTEQSEVAGTEWYDSGIGFAVPLVDILARLDTLKKGQDLRPGIMGIALKGTNIYALPATIAACPPKSPAREAGLQPGDTIVAVDGVKIQRQAQLKHVLGPHVAGDTIRVVATRPTDKQRLEVTMQLVAEVQPYVRPFLGILPLRSETAATAGVAVRFVFPDSPAAAAGLKPNDRIVALGEEDVADAESMRRRVAEMNPGDQVQVQYMRGAKQQAVKVTLGKEPTTIPAELPAAHGPLQPGGNERPETGLISIKIPEEANQCVAYVPENYDPRLRYSLLVWLPPPGAFDKTAFVERWKERCARSDLILLVPQARDSQRWSVLEADFVGKTIDEVVQRYSIDPARIALHGYQAGGAMAYLVAFTHRDVAHAVAAVDTPLPQRVATPTADPNQALAIYSIDFEKSPATPSIEAGIRRLEKSAFNVVRESLAGASRYLKAKELGTLVRWVDTLDRI